MRSKTLRVCAFALMWLMTMSTLAQAGTVRQGSEVVEIGWPGSYFLSQTEAEFRSRGCPEPSALAKRNLDAAIVDVDPGSILKIELSDPVGSMNIAFYDEDCDPQLGVYWIGWAGDGHEYTKKLSDRFEWAVITFNYGYDIALDWKVCSVTC